MPNQKTRARRRLEKARRTDLRLELLFIPRELRDQILEHVIATPDEAPTKESITNPVEIRGRRELGGMDESTGCLAWWASSGVLYKNSNRTNSIPTLLVNRQLHAETMAAIHRFRGKHCYKVDVMVVNEAKLWPTWLSLPAYTTQIETLDVNFRIMGMQKYSRYERHAFELEDHGMSLSPEPMQFNLFYLLERFLRLGPPGDKQKREQLLASRLHVWTRGATGPNCDEYPSIVSDGVSIKHLDLNFETPDVPKDLIAPKNLTCIPQIQELREKSGIDYHFSAEYLLEFVIFRIEEFGLSMWRSEARFADVFYERIGTIRVFLDGKFQKEIDLAERLRDVKFNDSFRLHPSREEMEEFFGKWKISAWNQRVALGLHVVPLEGEDGEIAERMRAERESRVDANNLELLSH